MQSETGFPSSHQLKSYVASKSRLKLAARAVLSADAGLLVLCGQANEHRSPRRVVYRPCPQRLWKVTVKIKLIQITVWNLIFLDCLRHIKSLKLDFRSSPGDNLIDWKLRVSVCPSVRPYVRTSTKSFFSDFDLIWCVGRPRPHMRSSVTSNRSTVKVKVTELPNCENCTFLGLSPPPFLRRAQNWWLMVIAWDLDYSLPEPDFWISF